MQGLFISGSGTGVGKTFIAQHIVRALSDKLMVSVRKPVESDCTEENGVLITKDAVLLKNASNIDEDIDTICPYKFTQCASPELASASVQRPLSLENLVLAAQSPNFVVVEGAGGIYSPIAENALNVDLAKHLALPVVLVVKDELGAVNQALMADAAAKEHGLEALAIVLNQQQENTLDNDQAIRRYTQTPVLVYNAQRAQAFAAEVRDLV